MLSNVPFCSKDADADVLDDAGDSDESVCVCVRGVQCVYTRVYNYPPLSNLLLFAPLSADAAELLAWCTADW